MAAFSFVPIAQAAQCGRADRVTKFLGKKYAEKLIGMGMVGARGFMQFYVAKSGTWTVLMTTPEGISCIIAAGDSWQDAPAPEPDTY